MKPIATGAALLGTSAMICLGFAVDARAQPRNEASQSVVFVRPSHCDSGAYIDSSFLHLLEIELGTEHVRLATNEPTMGSGDLTIEVARTACDGNAREVVVALRRPPVVRAIVLGDLAVEARSRALALAVAELVRATRIEWRREEEAAATAARTASTDPARDLSRSNRSTSRDEVDTHPTRDDSPSRRLEAAAVWRIFAPSPTSMFGAQVAVDFTLAPAWLHFRADAFASWKNATDPFGTVSLTSYSGGIALLAAIGQNPTFRVGPHLELGYASVNGTPAQLVGTSSGGVITTASLMASISATLHGPWTAMAGLEGGTTLHGLTVSAPDDPELISMRGGFVSVRAGIALAF